MVGRLVKFVDRDGRYPEFEGAIGLVMRVNGTRRNYLAVKWTHPIPTKQVLVKGSHFHSNRFEVIS